MHLWQCSLNGVLSPFNIIIHEDFVKNAYHPPSGRRVIETLQGRLRRISDHRDGAPAFLPREILNLPGAAEHSAQERFSTETSTPTLLGLVTLVDPPRPNAKQLIAALRDLGVPVKTLTGDALAVASEIAQGVGRPNIRRVADLKAAGTQAGRRSQRTMSGKDCSGAGIQEW